MESWWKGHTPTKHWGARGCAALLCAPSTRKTEEGCRTLKGGDVSSVGQPPPLAPPPRHMRDPDPCEMDKKRKRVKNMYSRGCLPADTAPMAAIRTGFGGTHRGVAVGLQGAHHARLAMYPARGLTGMGAMGRGTGRHPSQPCSQQLTQPTTWDQRSLDRTPPPLACPPGAARSVAAGPPPEADPRPSAARWQKIWPRHSGLFVSTNGWLGGGCAGDSRQQVACIHTCMYRTRSVAPSRKLGCDHKLG